MPVLAQVVLGIAAVVGAVAYLWKAVLKPGAKLISTMDKLLPVAQELAEQFHDAPEAFATLREIALQFKADSGTSLRDVINRLEFAAEESRVVAKTMEANIETARRLAEQDRAQLAELIAKLNAANAGIKSAATSAAGVADDLEAAHVRAEEHGATSLPGEASDSAMRRPETPTSNGVKG